MNYLAHAFLSFNHPEILTGNMISDFVKGKKKYDYPVPIQRGIALHRMIDNFTDFHPATSIAKNFFHPYYRLYSGAFVDIVYDHFLAKNWTQYSDEKLETFINRFYNSLHDNYDILTEKTQGLMPYMIERNWLLSYRTVEGIHQILTQMDRRSKNRSKMQFASEELKEFYNEFEQEFTTFFEDLRQQANQKLLTL